MQAAVFASHQPSASIKREFFPTITKNSVPRDLENSSYMDRRTFDMLSAARCRMAESCQGLLTAQRLMHQCGDRYAHDIFTSRMSRETCAARNESASDIRCIPCSEIRMRAYNLWRSSISALLRIAGCSVFGEAAERSSSAAHGT